MFGFPITTARDEANRDTGQTYLTQWFERNRFELHPDQAAPYDVLLGRLGDDKLRQTGVDWQTQPQAASVDPNCVWFEQTKHNVCDQEHGLGFKSYWLAHGLNDRALASFAQSLALFGLPLTEPTMQTNSSGATVLTQWFERARFEWHPGKPAQYRVLLGLLGNELRTTPRDANVPGDWQVRWLKGIPCQSPCWEGVTPGVSTADDALERWQQSPIIDSAEVFTPPMQPGDSCVQWSWKSDGTSGGCAPFRDSDKKIYAISLGYPSYLDMQTIISAFGVPSAVAAGTDQSASGQPIYRVTFIYLARGFRVDVLDDGSTQPLLSGDTRTTSPTFFAPSEAGLHAANSTIAVLQQLVAWQGFQDFAFYCRTQAGAVCQ